MPARFHLFQVVRLPAGTPYNLGSGNMVKLPVAMDAYRCSACGAYGDPREPEPCRDPPRRRNGEGGLHAIDGGKPEEDDDEQA